METSMNATQFEKDLETLINANSMESESDTPDFILAEYLRGCLALFGKTVRRREEWYGRTPRFGGEGPVPVAPEMREVIASGPDGFTLRSVDKP